MRFSTILLIIFSILCSFSAHAQQPRLINGTNTDIDNYPWMVWMDNCAGTLVAPDWVVTAAHCFLNASGSALDVSSSRIARLNILLNSTTLSPAASDSIRTGAKQVIIHPNYNPRASNPDNFDIALVQLIAPTTQPTVLIHDTALATESIPPETLVTVLGWGTTRLNIFGTPVDASNILQQATLKIVSQANCQRIYGSRITANMICAGAKTSNDTSDACQGDSGGGLVVNVNNQWLQIGIVSFGGTARGAVCGDPRSAGVYTRISNVADFIKQHVTAARFATLASLSVLPALNGAFGVNMQGVAFETSAGIVGGTAINGILFTRRTVLKLTDYVNISAVIQADTQDIGKTADIWIYAEMTSRATGKTMSYLLNSLGTPIVWQGDMQAVSLFKPRVVLNAQYPLTLYAGRLYETGGLKIWLGYRLETGNLIFNQLPIELQIE